MPEPQKYTDRNGVEFLRIHARDLSAFLADPSNIGYKDGVIKEEPGTGFYRAYHVDAGVGPEHLTGDDLFPEDVEETAEKERKNAVRREKKAQRIKRKKRQGESHDG